MNLLEGCRGVRCAAGVGHLEGVQQRHLAEVLVQVELTLHVVTERHETHAHAAVAMATGVDVELVYDAAHEVEHAIEVAPADASRLVDGEDDVSGINAACGKRNW